MTATAHAEPRVAVVWSAPDECPSSAELASRTTARVPETTAVRANGRVTKSGTKYRLELAIEGGSSKGERVLEADSCDALATSAAVVIAMSVAPQRDEPAEPSPQPPAAAAAPAPSPPPKPTPPDHDASPARPSPLPARGTITLRPDVVVDGGLMPSFAVGGGGAIGLNVGRALHVEAHGAAFASQDAHAANADEGGSFSLFAGGARACWAVTARVEISPCAGVVVARLGATGFGAAKVGDGEAVTWGPEAGASVLVPIAGPVGVRAGAFAFLPISRRSFVITAVGEVHQPAAVAARGFVGPEVRF